MSTARGAKLKAQYNRVRTSTALRGNDMWAKTIGVEFNEAGTNAVIEAAIYAPTHGGGASGRSQRREQAQMVIKTTGYQPNVTDYQGLLTLAKAQGSLGVGARGACKRCGGMGHLTKQCTNFLTGHNAVTGVDTVPGAQGASGAGPSLGLLPDPDALSDLHDLSSSDSEGDQGSGTSSGSDDERDKKRDQKSSKRRRTKDKKSKEGKQKSKKDKKRKHKKEKASKRKRSKREDDGSASVSD